jgi:transposase, IS30 family
MSKDYKHLTQKQRWQIEGFLKSNFCKKEIATTLNISLSTIYRELKNNGNSKGLYTAKSAYIKAKKRKQISANNPKKLTGKLLLYVLSKLQLHWSPEQISGRLRLDRKIKLSDSAIYEYVAKGRQTLLKPKAQRPKKA